MRRLDRQIARFAFAACAVGAMEHASRRAGALACAKHDAAILPIFGCQGYRSGRAVTLPLSYGYRVGRSDNIAYERILRKRTYDSRRFGTRGIKRNIVAQMLDTKKTCNPSCADFQKERRAALRLSVFLCRSKRERCGFPLCPDKIHAWVDMNMGGCCVVSIISPSTARRVDPTPRPWGAVWTRCRGCS